MHPRRPTRSRTRPGRLHRRSRGSQRIRPTSRVIVISVLATSLGAPTFGVGALALSMASASAATTRDVAVATEALASAKASRVAADRRHTELAAQLDELTARLDAEFAGAAELAADLEAARSEMRRSAITAFISGGDGDRAFEFFTHGDLAELSGRRTFSQSRTLDWADAMTAYEALKRDNDPKLVALSEQREALASKVADALDAVFQAGATEADAERQVAEAAAQAAEAEAAAAAQARAGAERTAKAAKDSRNAPAATAPPPARAGAVPAATPATNPAVGGGIVILTEPSAPLPELPDGGPSAEAWAEVRRCESGGNYRAVSRSGRYRGAYQFDMQTWAAMGGKGDPAGALPLEQDARARLLFNQRGARAWPQCGRVLL